MPELPRYSEDIGKYIGQGREQRVFEDKKDPTLVVKERKLENAEGKVPRLFPEEVKAEFYLTKIVHTLLPDIIPDTVMATAAMSEDGTSQKITKKVDILSDPDQRIATQSFSKTDRREALTRIKDDPRVHAAIERLTQVGFTNFDKASVNFVRTNEEGPAMYVDELWYPDVDIDILRQRIEELPEGPQKKRVYGWLERFLVLRKEALQKRGERT